MSSSTSSSRQIYLKIFLAISLGMAASMAIIRLITYLNDVSGQNFLGRVIEARAALPRILAEEDDLVMVFGSSMVRAAFSARLFDRQLREQGINVKSFNFGFGGLNPLFQDYLARRIREAFQAEDRRLKLAVLEFNPFQTTISRHNGAKPVVDSFVTMLASPQEIWDITLDDPKRGSLMMTIHYLRDDVSAQMITSHFGDDLRPPDPRSAIEEEEGAADRLQELGEELNKRFEEDYPDYNDENWHYGWQGAGTIPDERSESTHEVFTQYYQALRTQRRLDNDRIQRTNCCDIVDLNFDEELVEAYIRMVKNFQQFSDHVEVILLPRNTEWIQYPPEAVERMSVVLSRIRKETGVKIQNLQELEGIGPDMFSDTTHLARYSGDVAFTRYLAQRYSPVLGAEHR